MYDLREFDIAAYKDLKAEEKQLQEINSGLREFDAELNEEKNELSFLQKLIQRIKAKIADFDNKHAELVRSFIANLDKRNPLRVYDPRLDKAFEAYAGIEFDLFLLDHIIKRLKKRFEAGKTRKLAKFHADLSEQQKKIISYFNIIRENVLGKGTRAYQEIHFENMGDSDMKTFIKTQGRMIKEIFMATRGLRTAESVNKAA